MKPRVLNIRKSGTPPGSVFIGRPSKWGNPFEIGKHGTREEVIQKFKEWFEARPRMKAKALFELRGKNLVCYCAPDKCHGDVLLSFANQHVKPTAFDNNETQ